MEVLSCEAGEKAGSPGFCRWPAFEQFCSKPMPTSFGVLTSVGRIKGGLLS